MSTSDIERLRAHIGSLELELQSTKAALHSLELLHSNVDLGNGNGNGNDHGLLNPLARTISLPITPSLSSLLLLSDSALPLGSFAYSSGLESFLTHVKQKSSSSTSSLLTLFRSVFLPLSISSISSTTIPYVLASYRDPLSLADLDNDFDASTPCTVARRASVSQGRALLTVWEKAFSNTSSRLQSQSQSTSSTSTPTNLLASTAISTFSTDLKISALSHDSPSTRPLGPNGHIAPLWGVVCSAVNLNLEETAYVFLFNHAKAVVSAAVRASVMGPYMAQSILASADLQNMIREALEKVWMIKPEDAVQSVPMLDLWMGRHEMLYSRIFNS